MTFRQQPAMIRRRVPAGGFLLLFFLLGVGPAAARVIIEPVVSVSTRYESNYFRDAVMEDEAITFLLRPGFEAGLESARSRFSVRYSLDAYFYEGQAEADDFIGHTLNARLDTETPWPRLGFKATDNLKRSRDAADLDPLSNVVDREEFTTNRFGASLNYELDRVEVRLGYGNQLTDYDTGAKEGSILNRGRLEIDYHLNRDHTIGADYRVWTLNYDPGTADYVSRAVGLRYRRSFRTLRFGMGGGWHGRDFAAGGPADLDNAFWSVSLRGRAPEGTGVSDLGFRLAATRAVNEQGRGNDYYEAQRLSLELDRPFGERFTARLSGWYQKSDYETADREDDTYAFSGTLEYRLARWLVLAVSAGSETRDSDLAGNDYDNLYTLLRLTWRNPPEE